MCGANPPGASALFTLRVVKVVVTGYYVVSVDCYVVMKDSLWYDGLLDWDQTVVLICYHIGEMDFYVVTMDYYVVMMVDLHLTFNAHVECEAVCCQVFCLMLGHQTRNPIVWCVGGVMGGAVNAHLSICVSSHVHVSVPHVGVCTGVSVCWGMCMSLWKGEGAPVRVLST